MATITSTASGNASDGSTWAGGVAPVPGDAVVIAAGHVVVLDGDLTWGNDTTTAISIYGTLSYPRDASASLTCVGNITVYSGGHFDMGTVASPIPATYTSKIFLNSSASPAHNKYGFLTRGDDPKVTVCGATVTRNTLLSEIAAVSQNVIEVEEADGWAIGDRIIIFCPGDLYSTSHSLITTITDIDGTTVTLADNINETDHIVGTPVSHLESNVEFLLASAYRSHIHLYHDSNISNENESYIRNAHILVEGGGSGITNTTYYAYSVNVQAERNTGYKYKKVSDITGCCIEANTSAGCAGVANLRTRGLLIENCALVNAETSTGRGTAIYTPDSSPLTARTSFCWNHSNGFSSSYSSGGISCRLSGCYFLNSGFAFNIGSGFSIHYTDCVFAGYGSCRAILNNCSDLKFTRCDFGYTLGALSGYTSMPIYDYSTRPMSDVAFIDCLFHDDVVLDYRIYLTYPGHRVVVANKNQDPLKQYIFQPEGTISRDDTFSKDTSGTSLKMSPLTTADGPLQATFKVFAPTGKPIIVSGFVFVNSLYGSSTLPSLTMEGLGLSDTWNAEDAPDGWQQFKLALTQNTGADSMFDVTISAQSLNAGAAIWIDGVSAPTPIAVATGEFGYWSNGLPAQIITANFVAAADVWNVQTDQLTLEGSVGKKVSNDIPAAIDDVMAASLAG